MLNDFNLFFFFSEQTVKNSYEFVFVKFYSPMCSHCHTMAPSWRELALQLNTVIKIAAVNCADDRFLCRQEGISSYPSLILYPNVCLTLSTFNMV